MIISEMNNKIMNKTQEDRFDKSGLNVIQLMGV